MQKAVNFVPAGATKMLVMVDKTQFCEPQGEWMSPYCKKKNKFLSFVDLIMQIDSFYTQHGFLQQTMQPRSFKKSKSEKVLKRLEVTKYMSDNLFEENKGEKATFVIQVLFRQNATWQGKVKWVEGGEETKFRSTLELLKLMDEAMAQKEENIQEIN